MTPTRTMPALAAIAVALAAPANGQQRGAMACSADDVVAWIGIEALDCNCSREAGGRNDGEWSFRSEPVVRRIADGSPADGVLREGDVIIAVNGALITTAAGGREFARRRPGRSMTFTIRRDGRTQTVRLTPVGLCPEDSRVGGDRALGSGQTSASRARSRDSSRDDAARLAAPAQAPPGQVLPTGRLGFGFSCSDCAWRRSDDEDEPRWYFRMHPQVYNVEPGSPADRAGLRRGDVITHVDGADLLTERGARRFGRIRPGEQVRLTIVRDGAVRNATLRADDRSGIAELTEAAEEIRNELERLLGSRGSTDELRRRITEIAEQLERLDARITLEWGEPDDRRSNALRYAGSVGDAEVEVRGTGSVITTIIEPGRHLLIVTDGAQIRIRAPDRDGDEPRR